MKQIIFVMVLFTALFVSGCSQDETSIVGNDRDEHDCIGSAGYVWSEEKQECERPFEEEILVGDDRDEYGCIGSAGYVWSEKKEECIRPFEE